MLILEALPEHEASWWCVRNDAKDAQGVAFALLFDAEQAMTQGDYKRATGLYAESLLALPEEVSTQTKEACALRICLAQAMADESYSCECVSSGHVLLELELQFVQGVAAWSAGEFKQAMRSLSQAFVSTQIQEAFAPYEALAATWVALAAWRAGRAREARRYAKLARRQEASYEVEQLKRALSWCEILGSIQFSLSEGGQEQFLWAKLERLHDESDPPDTVWARVAYELSSRWQVELAQARAGEDELATPQLKVELSVVGELMLEGEVVVHLGRRKTIHRILRHLCQCHLDHPGVSIPLESLIEVGWPGKALSHTQGVQRAYRAMSTLRKLGLEDHLRRDDRGYAFVAHCEVTLPEVVQ